MIVASHVWVITIAIMAAILILDVFILGRRPHTPSMRECTVWVTIYVALALAFGAGVYQLSGPQYGKQFLAVWLTEYSLSLDNLFIFIIIMQKLKVPRALQQFALLVGIILALVFRGVFIALGAAVLERWAWVFFLFGAFLLYTAFDLVKDYFEQDADGESTDNLAMRLFRRRFPATEDFRGTKLTVREQGKRLVTPMLLVIVALGSTDLLFALDSIPASYGLTLEPFLIFTANVFALMGLRQLYFMLGGLLKKLVYLSIGLAVILAFIGVKLLLHALHHYHWDSWLPFPAEISVEASLGVIVVTLAITAVASWLRTRSDPTVPPMADPGVASEAVSSEDHPARP